MLSCIGVATSKFSKATIFWTCVRKQKPYHGKTKQKKNKATHLLPYRVQSPPVTLINYFYSTSAKKVTFTQTRVHKYLSVRTQMGDIFQGSSLYASAQMQFLHEDKELGCCGWHSGFGRTP